MIPNSAFAKSTNITIPAYRSANKNNHENIQSIFEFLKKTLPVFLLINFGEFSLKIRIILLWELLIGQKTLYTKCVFIIGYRTKNPMHKNMFL